MTTPLLFLLDSAAVIRHTLSRGLEPEIQRRYVWCSTRVCDLCDALYRARRDR